MPSRGEDTKRNIIEKAMHLFASKGYHHTSIRDIIEAAGITRGGLYGHFSSKEDIWSGAYKECARLWKGIVLAGVGGICDPVARLERVVENSMERYLGAGVFDGGCMLFNSLVELSKEPSEAGRQVLGGFRSFSKMMQSWLEEADSKGMLREGVDHEAAANFIMAALSGTGPLYASSKDPAMWRQTLSQLLFYISQLKRGK